MRYLLFMLLAMLISCQKVSIGKFDLKYGTGSDTWESNERGDRVKRQDHWH